MFTKIAINDIENWDRIVKNFDNFDVYYLSGYVKAFQIHGDGEPVLFFYKDEKIRAMNVVMKNDIASNEKFLGKIPSNTLFDITTPYGYGGFIIEGEIGIDNLERLNSEYNILCKKENIISEFVKFHPVLKNAMHQNILYDIIDLGRTIMVDIKSKEHIWTTLTSKNRNMIRKAKKSKVNIYWGRDPWLFEEFAILYNSTMEKKNAKKYYYFKKNFYDSILIDMKYNSLVFYAKFEEQIIAMSIIIFAGKIMHYHLSAINVEYKNFAPINLLLYEASCWGSENGYEFLHLGGGVGSKEDSLFEFKATFNKSSTTRFSIGRKIFDDDKYKELLEIRKQDMNFKEDSSFLIAYRQ